VTQPYIIPDTTAELDEGVRVVIPVYAIHHDPRYYPEPDRFDPERFSDEAKSFRPHFTFLPFGEGPRNCIGKPKHCINTVLHLELISFIITVLCFISYCYIVQYCFLYCIGKPQYLYNIEEYICSLFTVKITNQKFMVCKYPNTNVLSV